MGRIKAITIEDDEEFLRQISVPVNLDDKELKNDISILEEFCNENDVMAMAAVQLGIPKRIVYLKNNLVYQRLLKFLLCRFRFHLRKLYK